MLDLQPADLTLAVPPSTISMLVFSVGNAKLLHGFCTQADNYLDTLACRSYDLVTGPRKDLRILLSIDR